MNMRAKKSLGQNFLNAPQVIQKMVDISHVTNGDFVIEIGPGKGVLTEALLLRGAVVWCYELDQRMVDYLSEKYSTYINSGQLTIIHRDILEVDIEKELPKGSYKVVANIPYYISNAILRQFLSTVHQPTDMCLLVQKEVAQRIAQDTKESILSLSVKVYGTPRYVTKVPARYFSPQPKVDSAVIHIGNISRNAFSTARDEHRFFAVVKQGFAYKRKQLASNLGEVFFDKLYWQQVLKERGYPHTVRAEDVNLEDWIYLSNLLE